MVSLRRTAPSKKGAAPPKKGAAAAGKRAAAKPKLPRGARAKQIGQAFTATRRAEGNDIPNAQRVLDHALPADINLLSPPPV